jgi:hypothetical protein
MSIKDKDGSVVEIRRFCLTMSKEKRDIVLMAINTCKDIALNDGQVIDDSRALELVCAEFLSTYQKPTKTINLV